MAQRWACKACPLELDGKRMVQADTYRVFDTALAIKWGLVFVLLTAIALLIGMGLPRLLAEIALVPGTPIYNDIARNKEISADQLHLLIRTRQDALGFTDYPESYTEIAVAHINLALMADDEQMRREHSEVGLEALQKSLALKPANSFNWLRVCRILLSLKSEPPEVALEAWAKSIQYGEFDKNLMYIRVHLGILLYKQMSPEHISALREQMTHAWNWQRYSFRTYMEQNNLVPWAAFVLRDAPQIVDFMRRKDGINH